ncbi:class IV adenylate cyclase [Peptoniphilus asaccharolyticus]
MEREIEVKLLGLDVEAFEDKLLQIGTEKFLEESQLNITINSTKHPIDKTLGYLRIRESKNLTTGECANYFTFKEQITDQNVRENIEHTTEISDVAELRKILILMGYDLQDEGGKQRTSYKFKNIRFDVDRWDERTYPYPYVEVEANSEDELYSILEELGVDKAHVSTMSIAELKASLSK